MMGRVKMHTVRMWGKKMMVWEAQNLDARRHGERNSIRERANAWRAYCA